MSSLVQGAPENQRPTPTLSLPLRGRGDRKDRTRKRQRQSASDARAGLEIGDLVDVAVEGTGDASGRQLAGSVKNPGSTETDSAYET